MADRTIPVSDSPSSGRISSLTANTPVALERESSDVPASTGAVATDLADPLVALRAIAAGQADPLDALWQIAASRFDYADAERSIKAGEANTLKAFSAVAARRTELFIKLSREAKIPDAINAIMTKQAAIIKAASDDQAPEFKKVVVSLEKLWGQQEAKTVALFAVYGEALDKQKLTTNMGLGWNDTIVRMAAAMTDQTVKIERMLAALKAGWKKPSKGESSNKPSCPH